MFPTGSYERFQHDIIYRYNTHGDNDFVTFGILIADPRQDQAREFIFNYLDMFDDESGKYFDFFIPGYDTYSYHSDEKEVYTSINNKNYYFNYDLFFDFINRLKSDFNINYTFNPMLILMTMQLGRKHTAKYIVLELDDSPGIPRCGMLFEDIFQTARTTLQLNDFQGMLRKTYIEGNLLSSIINAIGQKWLIELNNTCRNMRRYKIIKFPN